MKIFTLAVCSPLLRLEEKFPAGSAYFHLGQEQSFSFMPSSSPPRTSPHSDGHTRVQDLTKGVGRRHWIPGRLYTHRLLNAESLSDDIILSTSYLLARSFLSILFVFFSQSRLNLVSTSKNKNSLQRYMVIFLCRWLLWVINFTSALSHHRGGETERETLPLEYH